MYQNIISQPQEEVSNQKLYLDNRKILDKAKILSQKKQDDNELTDLEIKRELDENNKS